MVQGLLALHLKTEGFIVSIASSGKEMCSILEKEAIDIVLLDLNRPSRRNIPHMSPRSCN